MKLIDWMKKTNITIDEAALAFGASVFAVRKWIRGERNPRAIMQRTIKKVTKGAVTGDDWIDNKRELGD